MALPTRQTLIIGRDWQLRPALERQFTQRGRYWRSVAPGGIAALRDSLAARDLVVDVASFEALVDGIHRGWSRTEFESLVKCCRRSGAALLMVSHAGIYRWRQRHRCPTTENPEPGSAAARELLARERLVTGLARGLVLRTGYVLGTGAGGLLVGVLGQLRRGGPVALAMEPRQSFTCADDLARVVTALIDQLDCSDGLWGVYHYQGRDMLSCYDAGERLLAAAGQFWPLPAVTLEVAPQPRLPAVPALDCSRIRDTFGIQQRALGGALTAMLHQLSQEVP